MVKFHWLQRAIQTVSAKGGIFMFLRAQLSSQVSAWADFIISYLVFKLANPLLKAVSEGIWYWSGAHIPDYICASFFGSFCGGIVNCIINYRWTFKARGQSKRAMILKFLLVWTGSMVLNTYGTYWGMEALKRWNWLTESLGHLFDDVFIVPKLVVSIVVGLVWNYNLQRIFVYRERAFRRLFHKQNINNERKTD